MHETLRKRISYSCGGFTCSAGLEVDDESPIRNDVVLTLLAQRCTIIRRIYSIIVAQFCAQGNRKTKVKRRPDVYAVKPSLT